MPDTFDPDSISYVTSFPEITARHPEPMLRATGKVLPALDRHCRAMIERSTFCVISSFGPGRHNRIWFAATLAIYHCWLLTLA